MTLEKDKSIQDLIWLLRSELGPDDYQVVDYWDADLYSIGIVGRKDSTKLIYVSTYHQPPGCYMFECEQHFKEEADIHYETVQQGDGIDFASLSQVIREYLLN